MLNDSGTHGYAIPMASETIRGKRLVSKIAWGLFTVVLCFVLLLVLFRVIFHTGQFMEEVHKVWSFAIFAMNEIWRVFMSIGQPQATIFVGLLALVIGVLGWNQKRHADAKSEWWRRAQYSMDLVLSGEKESIITGARFLKHLCSHGTEKRLLIPGLAWAPDEDDRNLIKIIIMRFVDPNLVNESKLQLEDSSEGNSDA